MSETNIFKVLSDKQRRDILEMLKDGRMSAGEIAEKMGLSPAALSYHLKLLKGADLIMEYKQKNFSMRMAKISFILSFIPLMVNAWVTQYLPNKVPIHYNLSGEVDGWGSRYSSMIVPITIIISAIVWFLVINHIEKRVQSCEDEKKIKADLSNMKVLGVVTLTLTSVLSIEHFISLYKMYSMTNNTGKLLELDETRQMCVSMAIIFILLGNVLPLTRNNYLVGVRIYWSMYNDNTWRKSNRFGGILFVIAGLLMLIVAIIGNPKSYIPAVIGCLLVITILVIAYSYIVYKEEIKKKESA